MSPMTHSVETIAKVASYKPGGLRPSKEAAESRPIVALWDLAFNFANSLTTAVPL